MSTPTTTKQLIQHSGQLNPWGRNRTLQAEQAEIAAKLNLEARENWDNDVWHRQVANDIASSLDYGFTNENIFGSYILTENVGEFDRIYIRERRGMKVYFTSRGGYIDESTMRTEIWELPRDTMGFHVSEHIDKLRADFATQISEMVTKGTARLEAEVTRRLLSLVQTAIPLGSPNYVATAGMTGPVLDAAIMAVRDAIKPDGVGPVPITIIGRAAMIDKIAGFVPTFSPIVNEEVRQQGFIGHYKGAQVLVLNNYTDEDGLSYNPGNEVWVLGGTAGKFALYGGTVVKSWDENTVDYRHYRARKDVGGLINHPEQVRRLVDSSVTP